MIVDKHRLIIFDKKNSNGAYGRYDRYNVFLHTDSPNTPSLGEAWYCELEIKPSNYNYVIFAKAIERFEISSLSIFDKEDIRKLADYITQYHPDKVEKILATSGRLVVNKSATAESIDSGDIVYLGNDVLKSHRFGNGSYNFERSADGSCLLIQKTNVGRLFATDYKIKVGGLDSLLGDYVGKNLQYSEIEEGLLIKIGDCGSEQTT